MSNAFFYDLLASVADRGRSMLKIKPWPKDADNRVEQLVEDCRALVAGQRRSVGGRARRRDHRALPRPRSRRSCGVLPRACRRFRSRSRAGAGRNRQVRVGRRRSRGERNPLCLRAAPSRVVPAAQSRARRHRRAGRDARGPAPAREAEPVARHRRSRFSASVRFVVQSRLSGVAPHRLVVASGASRKDHPLRGGARNWRLGRTQAAHRSGRPAVLRVLPSEAGRRAADLRRSRADRSPRRRRLRRCSRKSARMSRRRRRAWPRSIRSPIASRASPGSISATSSSSRWSRRSAANCRRSRASSPCRRFRDSAPGSRRPRIRRSRP